MKHAREKAVSVCAKENPCGKKIKGSGIGIKRLKSLPRDSPHILMDTLQFPELYKFHLAQKAATVAFSLERWQNQHLAHATAATSKRILKGVHL